MDEGDQTMRSRKAALELLLIGLTVFSLHYSVDAQTATPPPASDLIYTVRPGDTLFRIAGRFHMTYPELARADGITNPAQIYAGRQLRIPGAAGLPVTPIIPTQTASVPPASGTTTYTVVRGDTLYRVALKNNTSLQQLMALNNLPNPNIIYVGQTLIVPASTGIAATPVPTLSGQSTSTTSTLNTGYGFDYGIQAYFAGQDTQAVVNEIKTLGMRWAKIQVLWSDIEPTQGQPDFAGLDNIVDALKASNLNILFTVTSAPTWARASTDENGPPDNFVDFGTFMAA
jgi:LysM repeat protein